MSGVTIIAAMLSNLTLASNIKNAAHETRHTLDTVWNIMSEPRAIMETCEAKRYHEMPPTQGREHHGQMVRDESP